MANYFKGFLAGLAVAGAVFCVCYDSKVYVVDKKEVIAYPGATLWSISERYYDQDQKATCFDDFRCRVNSDNEKLMANGRYLQPGDKVVVNIYRVVKK